MRTTGRLPAVIAALLALSAGKAKAVEVDIDVEVAKESSKNPWRGSAVIYDHTFSAISLDKSALPDYNPYYTQTLVLRPEWHFSDALFVRATWSLEQELTTSDVYEGAHLVIPADLLLELNHTGWAEPATGINISGGLRVILPVSEKSAAEQLYFGLAPGLTLTRRFDVLQGLVVGYTGRSTFNFRKYATMQYDGARVRCRAGEADCDQYEVTATDSGRTTARYTFGHGPMVVLMATEKLSLSTFYTHGRARLYDLSDVHIDSKGYVDPNGDFVVEGGGYHWRDTEWFGFEVGYQLIDAVGVTAAVNTAHPQKRPSAENYTRFFNRYTAFSFAVNVDVDAVTQLF